MLRFLHTLCLLVTLVTTTSAADFGCHWMSHPAPDDTSHVWFRRTFVAAEPIATAFVHVATTGRFVLYVNGRNVSTALFVPNRTAKDTTAVALAFDIRRFLRPDTNTVALLYCPSVRTRRQLSVCFYGTTVDSARFAFYGDDTWLCRKADTWLRSDGGETMNRGVYAYRWTDTEQPLALWLAAEEYVPTVPIPLKDNGLSAEDICGYSPIRINPFTDDAPHIRSVTAPLFVEQTDRRLVAHLVPGFRGIVRVTLRGCQCGERIRIGSLLYTCSSEMDEQAFARFSLTTQNTIVISGDHDFRTEQVVEIGAANLNFEF